MNPLVMTRLARADALPEGESAVVQLDTTEGCLELRLTFEDAERLIAALQTAQAKIQAERAHSARPRQ
ncbi:MAG TPA: hypothetical protein VFZ81_03615 [Burkholderiales bacterium]